MHTVLKDLKHNLHLSNEIIQISPKCQNQINLLLVG